MPFDVVVPPLGDGITTGTVVQWLKPVGSEVRRDETLLEVSTDKVDTEVHAPEGGLLIEQLYAAGDQVEVGAVIARLGTPEEWAAIAPPPSPSQSGASQSMAAQGVTSASIEAILSGSMSGGAMGGGAKGGGAMGGGAMGGAAGPEASGPPPLFDDELDGAQTIMRTPEPPTQPQVRPISATPRLGPVAILSESSRDSQLVDAAIDALERYNVRVERQRLQMQNPKRVRSWAEAAVRRAVRAIIVCGGAGGHLAALVSAETRLPVIVVPRLGADGGFANLLGAVQAPGGVPLVAVCPGDRGARQAAAFVTRLLAAFDPGLHRALGIEALGDEDISFSQGPY